MSKIPQDYRVSPFVQCEVGRSIRVDREGYVILSALDVDRIAQRVAELIAARGGAPTTQGTSE